jgi:hypothetical protein
MDDYSSIVDVWSDRKNKRAMLAGAPVSPTG